MTHPGERLVVGMLTTVGTLIFAALAYSIITVPELRSAFVLTVAFIVTSYAVGHTLDWMGVLE